MGNQEIKKRLVALRNAEGLSQRAFAKRISISYGYQNAIEQGRYEVNDRIIKLVAGEFGVAESWLRTGEGEMYALRGHNIPRFVGLFQRLSPECQEFVIDQMEGLLGIQNALVPTQDEAGDGPD